MQPTIDFQDNGSLTMSPTEAFALARQTNSVDAIARVYPAIEGLLMILISLEKLCRVKIYLLVQLKRKISFEEKSLI